MKRLYVVVCLLLSAALLFSSGCLGFLGEGEMIAEAEGFINAGFITIGSSDPNGGNASIEDFLSARDDFSAAYSVLEDWDDTSGFRRTERYSLSGAALSSMYMCNATIDALKSRQCYSVAQDALEKGDISGAQTALGECRSLVTSSLANNAEATRILDDIDITYLDSGIQNDMAFEAAWLKAYRTYEEYLLFYDAYALIIDAYAADEAGNREEAEIALAGAEAAAVSLLSSDIVSVAAAAEGIMETVEEFRVYLGVKY